jgi:hypothetical protein
MQTFVAGSHLPHRHIKKAAFITVVVTFARFIPTHKPTLKHFGIMRVSLLWESVALIRTHE